MVDSKKIRVGVNTLFLVPNDVGGTETYLRSLLRAIASQDPSVDLVLFTNRENHGLFQEELKQFSSIEYVCLDFRAAVRPLRIIVEQLLLPFKVKKKHIDVLWSPGYTSPIWNQCPQVVTIHDLQYKNHPEDLTLLERTTLNFLVSQASRVCKKIIAVSEFSKQEIVKFGLSPEHKIHTVYEGVDPSFAENKSVEQLKSDFEHLIRDDEPYILCVAHSYPHKNVHLLVEAFNKVRNSLPHKLVLIGKPRLGEIKLQHALSSQDCADRVLRIDRSLPYGVLQCFYQKADMFVLPSSYEGFGLPVLEAMMAGTPVIAARLASLPEVGGKCALYVDPLTAEKLSDRILQCYQMNDVDRDSLTLEARRWARQFTWEKSAEETINVIKLALKA